MIHVIIVHQTVLRVVLFFFVFLFVFVRESLQIDGKVRNNITIVVI